MDVYCTGWSSSRVETSTRCEMEKRKRHANQDRLHSIQSVATGPSVYVGGGWALVYRNSCTVMKLDLQSDEWTKLPQYNAKYFAMTSFANQLVLVGGVDPVTWELTNQIAVFESGQWTSHYPP